MHPPDHSMAKDVGTRLREALKMQLTLIHERVEAKKIAKMALAEVRNILAKEQEEKLMDQKREEAQAKAWERMEARLKEVDVRVEREKEREMDREDLTEREELRKPIKEDDDEGREKNIAVPKGELDGKSVEMEAKSVKSKGHSKSRKKPSKSSV